MSLVQNFFSTVFDKYFSFPRNDEQKAQLVENRKIDFDAQASSQVLMVKILSEKILITMRCYK